VVSPLRFFVAAAVVAVVATAEVATADDGEATCDACPCSGTCSGTCSCSVICSYSGSCWSRCCSEICCDFFGDRCCDAARGSVCGLTCGRGSRGRGFVNETRAFPPSSCQQHRVVRRQLEIPRGSVDCLLSNAGFSAAVLS